MKLKISKEWISILSRWMKMDKDSIAIFISVLALIIAIVPFWWNDLRKKDSAEVVILNLWVKEDSLYLADMVFVNKGNTDLVIAEISISWKFKKKKNDGDYEYEPGVSRAGSWFTPEPFTLKAGEVLAKNYEIGLANAGFPYRNSQDCHKYCVESYFNFTVIDRTGAVRTTETHIVDQPLTGDWFTYVEKFPMTVTLLPSSKTTTYSSLPRKLLTDERKAELIQEYSEKTKENAHTKHNKLPNERKEPTAATSVDPVNTKPADTAHP